MPMVATFKFNNFVATSITLARRNVSNVASVPDDTILTFSIDGTRSMTSSASLFSCKVEAPKLVPLSTAS